MPTRCARCDAFAGRGRELSLPGDWVSYLRRERDVSEPVGTLKVPLCSDCSGGVEAIRDEDDADAAAEFLEEIAIDRLIDAR